MEDVRKLFSPYQLVLMALDEEKPRIVKSIYRRTGLSPNTIYKTLRELESLGLIETYREGNVRLVKLREKGKKVRGLLLEIWDLVSSKERT